MLELKSNHVNKNLKTVKQDLSYQMCPMWLIGDIVQILVFYLGPIKTHWVIDNHEK